MSDWIILSFFKNSWVGHSIIYTQKNSLLDQILNLKNVMKSWSTAHKGYERKGGKGFMTTWVKAWPQRGSMAYFMSLPFILFLLFSCSWHGSESIQRIAHCSKDWEGYEESKSYMKRNKVWIWLFGHESYHRGNKCQVSYIFSFQESLGVDS